MLGGIAAQIHSVPTELGFLYIKGHRIGPEIIDLAVEIAQDFFS